MVDEVIMYFCIFDLIKPSLSETGSTDILLEFSNIRNFVNTVEIQYLKFNCLK